MPWAGVLSCFTAFSAMIANVWVYKSLQPILVNGIVYCIGYAAVWITGIGGKPGRRLYPFLFSIYWFISALTAVFDLRFADPMHPGNSDALYFFTVTTDSRYDGMSLAETWSAINDEDAGAMLPWLKAYQLLAYCGFGKGRYVGIAINVAFVALASVVGLSMVRTIFGDDSPRLRRYAVLCSSCGMFWLFASIHIRDASILFAVSLLTLCWVRYLEYRRTRDALLLIVATAAAFFSFGSLRREFIFVPLAMLVAGAAAIWFTAKSRTFGLLVLSAAVASIAIAVNLDWRPTEAFKATMAEGQESYSKLSSSESDSTSLGNRLVVGQPAVIRTILGTAYLFVAPVPFWAGFRQPSSYHVLKSLNAFFMYVIMPLLILAVLRLVQRQRLRRASLIFLAFVVSGFALSVAYTSLESRHLAAFFVPLLVFLLVPDLTVAKEKRNYGLLLGGYLLAIFLGHLAWAVLKGSGGA